MSTALEKIENLSYSWPCVFRQGSKLQLSDILEDQDILFNFMKFMKAEASVNVLQFYLSIGMLTFM